jgi:hypothetical protein
MKSKTNSARRNFFTKFGLGALSTGVMSMIPVTLFAGRKKSSPESGTQISITIDPMAVKRTNKG